MKNYYGMDIKDTVSFSEKAGGFIIFLTAWIISLYLIGKWIKSRREY